MDISQLKELAIKFNAYLNGDTKLFEVVNSLDKEVLNQHKGKYEEDAKKGKKPVNLLRYIILNLIERGESLTPESLEELKEQLENRKVEDFDFLDSLPYTNKLLVVVDILGEDS